MIALSLLAGNYGDGHDFMRFSVTDPSIRHPVHHRPEIAVIKFGMRYFLQVFSA